MGREDVDGQEVRESMVGFGTEVVENGIVRNPQFSAHEVDDRLGRSHDEADGGSKGSTEYDRKQNEWSAPYHGLLVRKFCRAECGRSRHGRGEGTARERKERVAGGGEG